MFVFFLRKILHNMPLKNITFPVKADFVENLNLCNYIHAEYLHFIFPFMLLGSK